MPATIHYHFQIETPDDVIVGCAQIYREDADSDFEIAIIGDEPERRGWLIPKHLDPASAEFALIEARLRADCADDIHAELTADEVEFA
jgi:hypothetical protein